MRTSRKQVERLLDVIGAELIQHQELGNRADYYYTYSIVANGTTLMHTTSLKEAYMYASSMMEKFSI